MKLAINQTVVGKPTTDKQNQKLTFTYENVDLDQDQLAESINQGFAFCAQHKNKHRKSANFICSDFIAVDIDYGLTIEEAVANPFVTSYCSILYTTPSHTNKDHRFRILFELENSITSSETMKNAYRGIIKKFGGDPSCKDACRQFYGSKNSNPSVFHKTMPEHILNEIISLGSESKSQKDMIESEYGSGKVSVVSNKRLDDDIQVKTTDGELHRLIDLPPQTSIHCPVHFDKKPSAFTLLSKEGVTGVHCVVCASTFFTSSYIPRYDFNYELLRRYPADIDPNVPVTCSVSPSRG